MNTHTYIEKQIISVSSQTAWEALKAMNLWLPTLSTNKAVTYDESSPFFVEGKRYNVETKEGITMKSQLVCIDSAALNVEIHAKWSLLKSFLTCQIKPIEANSCEIIRTQSYPGIVGKLFTSLFGKRESGETSEYLTVWGNYALQLQSK